MITGIEIYQEIEEIKNKILIIREERMKYKDCSPCYIRMTNRMRVLSQELEGLVTQNYEMMEDEEDE